MTEAYILAAVRTPLGKYLGALAELPAPQLGAVALAEALRRGGAKPEQVDEVIVGNVIQAGLGQNPARQAALKAGLPNTIAAFTVNKVCGSGLKSVMLAAQAIRAGDANLILAGGMENMSRAPYLLFGARTGWKYGDQKAVDAMIHDGLWCAFENWHMGEAAEHIAAKCSVSRADQDRFSVQSQQRAAAAWEKGLFDKEIVAVTIGSGPKARTVSRDEGFRPDTTAEALAKLKPAFHEGGTVTAGNASTLSDGAAAVLVGSEHAAERLGVKPLARIVAYATSGVAPKDIFIAPVLAIHQVLEKANMPLKEIDLIELNEAFAAQMLACRKQLDLNEAYVNVNGGAIALGHPIGASGTRVLVTLLHALEQRNLKRGLASLCLGGGNAVAMVVERMVQPELSIEVADRMGTVVIADQVRIPSWVNDLDSFRRWTRSDDYPERGWVSFLDGEIWVDTHMEQLFSHNRVKTCITVVLGGLVEAEQLGYFFSDRASLSNAGANLSTEADGTFCSFATIQDQRVTLVEGVEEGFVEIEGTPDMVLEVVSNRSVRKDTRLLRGLYWSAGIPEYWLIDARKSPLQFDILRWTERGYSSTRRKQGWLKSKVFGRSFLLETRPDLLGNPQFFLRFGTGETS